MADYDIGNGIADAEEVTPDLQATVERLAALPALEYDQVRDAEADMLGVRVSVLDGEVKKARKSNSYDTAKSGRELKLPEPEPWSEKVDGSDLLDRITRAFRRYVSLPDHTHEALALWIVHAHCLDATNISPRLLITSPEKRCGKSTLLLVLERLVPRPLAAMNVTPAVLFRTVEVCRPTLLVDEADTFAKDNEELRGIINSGHHRSGSVLRLVGEDYEPRQFSTWCAMVIAGIGNMPDTIEDRSIIVSMRRKRPDEVVERLRIDRTPDLDRLARMAARWKLDNIAALRELDPPTPSVLHDRAADNWRALLAIADIAGGKWSNRAREVAIALSNSGGSDDASVRVQLLADIQAIFEKTGEDKITSDALCVHLHEMEDRPWPEWKAGKPISKVQVARQLRHFAITSGTIRNGSGTAKGYKLEAFNDAFARYLPNRNVTTSQPAKNCGKSAISKRHNSISVTDQNSLKPALSNGCDVVTDQIGDVRANTHIADENSQVDDDIERAAIMNENHLEGTNVDG